MGFGVHDRFVDLGGFRSEAGDAHEVTVASGGQGGLADLGKFGAKALNLFRSDLGHIVTGLELVLCSPTPVSSAGEFSRSLIGEYRAIKRLWGKYHLTDCLRENPRKGSGSAIGMQEFA